LLGEGVRNVIAEKKIISEKGVPPDPETNSREVSAKKKCEYVCYKIYIKWPVRVVICAVRGARPPGVRC